MQWRSNLLLCVGQFKIIYQTINGNLLVDSCHREVGKMMMKGRTLLVQEDIGIDHRETCLMHFFNCKYITYRPVRWFFYFY